MGKMNSTKKQAIIEFALAFIFIGVLTPYVSFFHFDTVRNYLPESWTRACDENRIVATNGTATTEAFASSNFWIFQIPLLTISAVWIVSLVFLIVDARLDGTKKWAQLRHNYGTAAKKPTAPDWTKYLLAVRLSAMNCGVSVIALIYLFHPIVRKFSFDQVCAYEAEPWLLIGLRLVVTYLLTDFIFFTTHWVGHHPLIYSIPVLGHRLHHTFIATYAVDAAACSPIEHIFVNLAAVHLAPILAGLPAPLWCMWSVAAGINTCFSHCGYAKPDFLGAHGGPHDAHHALFTCEYGTDMYMDALFRTTKADYMKANEKRKLLRK